SAPGAHGYEGAVVREDHARLDAHARPTNAREIAEQRGPRLVDFAHADRYRQLHCARWSEKLSETAGELRGVELDRPFHALAGVAAMDVLAKPTEVDGLAAHFRALSVEVTRKDRVVYKREAVDDARLAGTVGAVDESDRPERYLLD